MTKFHSLYSSTNIIRTIKPGRTKLKGHAAHMTNEKCIQNFVLKTSNVETASNNKT
jgi:hypothetical protein